MRGKEEEVVRGGVSDRRVVPAVREKKQQQQQPQQQQRHQGRKEQEEKERMRETERPRLREGLIETMVTNPSAAPNGGVSSTITKTSVRKPSQDFNQATWAYYAKSFTYLLGWSFVSGMIIILNNWIMVGRCRLTPS